MLRLLALALVSAAVAFGSAGSAQRAGGADTAWRQWGGPTRDFVVRATGLADSWPAEGPRVIWTRTLGTGHSGMVLDEGRLFTMFRTGNGRTRQGPWDATENVVALDAATGETVWAHTYASAHADFSYGAGPHSTPLVVGDRLFTIGTNKQLFALDKRTGRILWSHDLVREFGAPVLLIRPVVKAGYGCSPLAYRDTIICSVGGPGQSVMAFRQADGHVVWKSGDFHTSEAAPILISVGGRDQLVVFGGGTINGLDPVTGDVLWSHPHDPGNDLNMSTPVWAAPHNLLLVSSAYKTGSRAIRLTPRSDGQTQVDEVWYGTRTRFMFLSTIRIGDYVYGTSGDLGPSFLTAIDVRTGQIAWQHRGIGRASLVYADGKAILLEEDGDLTLARLSPEGVTVLAQKPKLFDTMSWTAPTLVGTTLYARDREKMVALDLGAPGAAGQAPIPSGPEVMLSSGASGESGTAAGAARAAGPAGADAPSLTGTWKLDRAASRIGQPAAPAGLVKTGAPDTLHITHAANGTVVVESQINESQARVYRPGGRTTSPLVPSGTIAMSARWENRALTAEGTIEGAPGLTSPLAVKETLAMGADGRLTLTIAIGTDTSTLVYGRTSTVPPCTAWPTPCKS